MRPIGSNVLSARSQNNPTKRSVVSPIDTGKPFDGPANNFIRHLIYVAGTFYNDMVTSLRLSLSLRRYLTAGCNASLQIAQGFR